MVELNAFLGLLYCYAVLKANHERSSYIFATDGTGCEIFRCSMSETRFLVTLHCLRFDNPDDLPERQKTDKLAAISSLFEQFVTNSQKIYVVGESVTIDKSEENKFLVPTQCVLRLTKPIQGSNRNVTADNGFHPLSLLMN
nr:unnamed protein product [Callosobruchus chinensis]